jgi:hypothetical protein
MKQTRFPESTQYYAKDAIFAVLLAQVEQLPPLILVPQIIAEIEEYWNDI